jgi:gas vesicle protein
MNDQTDRNVMLYFLAGVGLGALVGAAAGLLLAPKSGVETREELGHKFEELKNKVTEWTKHRKEGAMKVAGAIADEVGA